MSNPGSEPGVLLYPDKKSQTEVTVAKFDLSPDEIW